ncbi:DNA (cytosine-5)-methyltransferase 1 [Enterococcus sp. DIV0187]
MSGKVYHPEALSPTLMTGSEVKIAIPNKRSENGLIVAGSLEGKYAQSNRVFRKEGNAPTLTTKSDGVNILVKEATRKGYQEAKPGDSINLSHPTSETRRGRVGKQLANTLLTSEEQAVVTKDLQIRRLTAKECWRLQGFPDWTYERAAKVNSEHQLYKKAGNSVTVPVIYDIARRLN